MSRNPTVNNPMTAAIRRDVNRATDAIKAGLEDPISNVLYDEFVRKFIPVLAGEVHQPAMEWVRLTGHPHCILNVYMPDGTLRYTIPPLLISADTSANLDNGYSMMQHFQDNGNLITDSPMNFLSMEIDIISRMTPAPKLSERMENIRYVDNILVEHGYASCIPDSVKAVVNKTIPVELEYDGYDSV